MRRVTRLLVVVAVAVAPLLWSSSPAQAYCAPEHSRCTNSCQENSLWYFLEHGEFPICPA